MTSRQSLMLAVSFVIAATAAGLITRQASQDAEREEQAPAATSARPGVGANVHPITAGPGRCLGCHVETDQEPLLAATVPGTCKRCHEKAHAGEEPHPKVEVAGDAPGEANVPLGPDGEAVCDTCHDPHGARAGLLREKGLMTACSSECHEEVGIQ